MSEIDFQIRIEQDSDARSFKRCVRYLLQHTFLLKDKDSKLYEFAVRSVNTQMLDSYFSVMGFAFITEKDDDICYRILSVKTHRLACGMKRFYSFTLIFLH